MLTAKPFDRAAGRAGKRDGMERASRHADPHWWRCMLECGRAVAQAKSCFNTDDLERLRLQRFHNVTTHEHRALGPLMLELQRLGYCIATQDWVESTQKINHSRPMRVWYSLIYRGPQPVKKPRKRRVLDPRQLDMWDVR